MKTTLMTLIALSTLTSTFALAQQPQQQKTQRQMQQQRQQLQRQECQAKGGLACDYYIAFFSEAVSEELFAVIGLENKRTLTLDNELAEGCQKIAGQNMQIANCEMAWENDGPRKTGTICHKVTHYMNGRDKPAGYVYGCELRKWLR